MCISRVSIGFLLIATMMQAYAEDKNNAYWPTSEWREASPASEGMNSSKLQELDRYIAEKLPNTTSLLIVKNGLIVAEKYYSGSAETLRSIYSVTKSAISCLIGMMLDHNIIQSLDQRLESILPSVFSEESEKLARVITIRHALTMTSGADPSMTSGIGKIDISTLFQIPLAAKPGTMFFYSDINYNILSMIITEKTGMQASDYAAAYLFGPLGIRNFKWRSYEGYTLGGVGLMLNARDMAKLGYMLLRKGKWDGKVLLSEQWINEATRPQVVTGQKYGNGGFDYGYGWWTADIGGFSTFGAFGFLGQIICVVPQFDLIVVVTGEQEKTGERLDIIKDIIIPSLIEN
jgi:CubicO group peptidase (beta-lactamase class C family)